MVSHDEESRYNQNFNYNSMGSWDSQEMFLMKD